MLSDIERAVNPLLRNAQRCMLQCPAVRSFRHRGLKRFYELGDGRKIRTDQRNRIQDVLFHLHRLKGELQSLWSVTISGNWRITFRFVEESHGRSTWKATTEDKELC